MRRIRRFRWARPLVTVSGKFFCGATWKLSFGLRFVAERAAVFAAIAAGEREV